jgi:hypothetical protein
METVTAPNTFLPFLQNTSPASAGCSKHKAWLQLPLSYEGWAWPNNTQRILHPLPMWEVYHSHLWPWKWPFSHIPWSSFDRTILVPNEGCFSWHFLFTATIGVVWVHSSMPSCDETTVNLKRASFCSHISFSLFPLAWTRLSLSHRCKWPPSLQPDYIAWPHPHSTFFDHEEGGSMFLRNAGIQNITRCHNPEDGKVF